MSATLACGGPARCTTTAIGLCCGHSKDTGVALVVELITKWIRIWAMLDHGPTARAWLAMRDRFGAIDENRRWEQVHGTMSAVIVTLMQLCWWPPNVWADRTGCQWMMGSDACSVIEIEDQITADVMNYLWQKLRLAIVAKASRVGPALGLCDCR